MLAHSLLFLYKAQELFSNTSEADMVNTMVALDLPIKWQRAPYDLLNRLREAGCTHYKIHLPLPGTHLKETIAAARRSVLPGRHATVMFDNKEHDTPETVVDAIRYQEQDGVNWSTVHASGGRELFKKLEERDLAKRVVAVTVLTSMSFQDVEEVYGNHRFMVVQRLARIAAEHGVDKFVCAVADIPHLRQAVRDICIPQIFTPGIRPDWFPAKTEQFMVATPHEAFKAGSDFPIVGRPITSSEGFDPSAAFKKIDEEMREPRLPNI